MTGVLLRCACVSLLVLLTACEGSPKGLEVLGRHLGGGISALGADAGAAGAPDACLAPAHLIHEIRGTGRSSPFVGQVVTIEGVVVGDFQPRDGDAFDTDLGGYYVQEEDADADADPRTSEGIFVSQRQPDVTVGQLVRVTGRVSDSDGETHLRSVSNLVTCAAAQELPTPATVTLPVADLDDLAAYVGMLVHFPQELVISEYFNYDRFGELVLSAPGPGRSRTYQPTSYLDPRDPAVNEALELAMRSRITLDDGRKAENPEIARHPAGGYFSLENRFRGGDVITGVTGVMSYAFGSYRVQPTADATYSERNPRPSDLPEVGGDLRAAVFNVLNYFEDFGGSGCGPHGSDGCRGADNMRELERQKAKIVAAVTTLDAHVVGLIEIENDGDQGALKDLVVALNAATAPGTYDYVDAGGPVGVDAIRVAIVYQPSAVIAVGDPAVLDVMAFLDPNGTGEDRNRAAIAQSFQATGSGERFTFVVNHFKSKGEACGRGDDDPVQGNCNATRTLAARVLLDWLESDPTGADDPDHMVVGDLNGYDHEDPIRQLEAGPDGVAGTRDDYVDLLDRFEGEYAYTYVFDGMLGYLDYALASPSLAAQVTGAAAWHINADEPDLLDYDLTFKRGAQSELFEPNPFRSSDHDPVVVGLALGR